MKPSLISITLGIALTANLQADNKVLPVLNQPLPDITDNANAPTHQINLNSAFGTEAIDNQVVRFTSQVSNGNRIMDFALFSSRTPVTRTNFLKYVNDGDYNHSIIHRSVTDFVIQGGGFYNTLPGTGLAVDSVPTDPTITNEFGVSNTEGTISMAKLGGDPDSATSQWFVSLSNNSDILDDQNGGFTVFGRITQSTMASAADFGDPLQFPIWNAGGTFSELPLIQSFDNTAPLAATDLILFPQVALAPLTAGDAGESTTLDYSVSSTGDPDLLTTSITEEGQLNIQYAANAYGNNTLTVTATDSVGNVVEDSFRVELLQTYTAWRQTAFSASDAANETLSGPTADPNNDGISNLELFLHGLSTSATHTEPVKVSETTLGEDIYPTFTFPILNHITGISYQIQKSSDLGLSETWTPVPHTEISRFTSGSVDTVSLRTNAAADTNSYYRLSFTLSE